ncbi:MAG: hypothetical protein ACOYL6_09080 [Bacteriovoracaceae bacterium]
MKKFFACALLVLSFNSFAQWFQINARVNANPYQLTAYVDNTFNAPIVCRGNVAGITYYGQSVYAYFNNVVIFPGMFANAYAYTNQTNPFVSVQSNVACAWY